jgi:hypothetical protein
MLTQALQRTRTFLLNSCFIFIFFFFFLLLPPLLLPLLPLLLPLTPLLLPPSSLSALGPEKGRTEVACQSNSGSAFTTGGGFSNLYQAPVWQKETIEKYFTAIAYELPYVNKSRVREGDNGFPCPQYNPKGRGYPDISMLGEEPIIR